MVSLSCLQRNAASAAHLWSRSLSGPKAEADSLRLSAAGALYVIILTMQVKQETKLGFFLRGEASTSNGGWRRHPSPRPDRSGLLYLGFSGRTNPPGSSFLSA